MRNEGDGLQNQCSAVMLTPAAHARPFEQGGLMRPHIRSAVLSAALVVAIAAPAIAGPPLLCRPYETGNARSLPWDGSRSWSGDLPGYKLENLIADTEALLTPSTPVIER